MARIARVVAPGLPHHVIQRGNRRQKIFFRKTDYELYLDLMSHWCGVYLVDIWAWCLMPNHVHLIAVPSTKQSMTQAISEAHRRYSRSINLRKGWRGHLWQDRYKSYPLDEQHVFHCARYIEMNPVRSQLVKNPEEWAYSSARAHLEGQDDRLVRVQPLLERMASNWREYLWADEEDIEILKNHEKTGRPMGSDLFVSELEEQLGRKLKKSKAGRKPKAEK